MATGKTNARYIKVLLDDVGDSNRDISASVSDVSGVGLDYSPTDVTAYSDGVINFTLGHPAAEIDISGPFNNTASTGGHVVLSGIINAPLTQTSYTLTVQFGIRAAATTGDPEFEGEYYVTSYLVQGDGTYTAHLVPATSTAPAWGTVA
jgi:hypothetical protein